MPQHNSAVISSLQSISSKAVSRRGLVLGGSKIAIGSALAFSVLGSSRFSGMVASAQESTPVPSPFDDDIAVLNYALTLEHLEASFYRDGISQYTFGMDGFNNSIDTMLAAIRDHELGHVETLTGVITQLGGTPVEEATYAFGYTDAQSFLATAAAIENLGVSAYDGAGQYIANADLLTAAGSIVAVEARHASYLNLITGANPFPAAFETPMSPDEVLAVAGPFIVS